MKCFLIRPAKKKTIGQNYKTMNEIDRRSADVSTSPSVAAIQMLDHTLDVVP